MAGPGRGIVLVRTEVGSSPPSAVLVEALALRGLHVVRTTPGHDVSEDHAAVVVLAVAGSAEAIRRSFVSRYKSPVVVLVPRASWFLVSEAFTAGATAVIDAVMPASEAARIVRAAVERVRAVPSSVMDEHFRERELASPLTPQQEHWLHVLAGGATVSELARREHQSLRTMNRNLQRVYAALRVTGLRGAIAWLRRREYRNGA
jgi:DNA-binding NarL/FixJ family response regulator